MPYPTIVFIPGYKGSRLRSTADRRLRWLSSLQLLPWDRTDLRLSETSVSPLEPVGILDEIRPFPGMVKDIYGGFLLELQRRLPGHRLAVFGYDWRLDLFEQSTRLQHFIQSLETLDSSPLHLIAHSMGGMIAACWLRHGGAVYRGQTSTWEGLSRVDRVVFAGVPFRGTAIALQYLLSGDPVGFNRSILSRQVVSTFPSAYEMLPSTPPAPLYSAETGRPLDVFDATVWQVAGLSEPAADSRGRCFINRYLKAGRDLALAVHGPGPAPRSGARRLLNFYGQDLATPHQLLWSERSRRLVLAGSPPAPQLRDLAFTVPGDGSISAASARLPEVFQPLGDELRVSAEHKGLFGATGVVERISDFLR